MNPALRILLWRFFPFLVLAGLLIGTERFYHRIHSAVIDLGNAPSAWITIPTGSDYRQVKDSLYSHHFISDEHRFESYVEMGRFANRFKPGRYLLKNRMSAGELVGMLTSGLQTPVKVTFHDIRTREELAAIVSRQIEADSISLCKLMSDQNYLKKFSATPSSLFNLLIPNTYEMWWTTSADQFLTRMHRESQAFWAGMRSRKADSMGFSRSQVIIMASIVEKETSRNEEKAIIAGVYINRLRKGMPLQADPTLIFAWKDYSIKRVLNRHKEIRSPYNTYQNKGLPPGPICLPSISSIDAVLHYQRHIYLYFCAKEDFSGYHVFSNNLQEHNRNARKYQAALKKLKIDN